MTKALFIVPSPHEQNIPPMDGIQYLDVDGVLQGGWWVSEVNVPCAVPSAPIIIESSDEKLDAIVANYPDILYIEDIPDA